MVPEKGHVGHPLIITMLSDRHVDMTVDISIPLPSHAHDHRHRRTPMHTHRDMHVYANHGEFSLFLLKVGRILHLGYDLIT